jgi:creatinine amidohydrolase
MTVRALALLGLAAFLAAGAAQAASTHFLEELTWTELRERIRSGAGTILVPIGGTEQNGPYIALGKHNARVRFLAERIAGELGSALIAPVIAYVPEGQVNPPTGHMRLPGTITVPPDVFEKVLESAARSFKQAGFRDIVFLGDHGDYQANMKAVAARLNREWAATSVRAHALEKYYRAAQIAEHAGAADTSLTLAIDPALVRVERLKTQLAPTAADGVQGDPRGASAESGHAIVERIVSQSVEAIRKVTSPR